MAKRDPSADAIARLAELRQLSDPAALVDGLAKLLADRTSYVLGRAAELAAERGVRSVLPQIVDAFQRLLTNAKLKDPGCAATTALATAIVKLDAGYEAEDALLAGCAHAHWEASWGGQTDHGVGVRGQCVIGLAAMRSRSALRCATERLAERDIARRPPAETRERVSWTVRADAARALTMIGSEAAAALLRFKALTGDPEPAVVSECLSGVIAIDGDDGLTLAEQFLTGQLDRRAGEDTFVDAALLAIGGARRPASFTLLRRHADALLAGDSRSTFIAAIALTRQDAAIDYLLELVATGDRPTSAAAIDALTPLRPLQNIGERLDQAKLRCRR